MAIYICLAHEEPKVFRSSIAIYHHIVIDHRDAFLRLPFNYYQRSLKYVDFGRFVCRCGRTGFRSLRDLIVHLSECQGISIIYQKGISKPTVYSDGMPMKAVEMLFKHRVTIKEATEALYLPDETARHAEKIADDFRRKSRISRTVYIDAASLYIAAFLNNDRVSQLDIARAFNISEVSVRKWYKKIVRVLGIEVPY